MWNLLWRSAPDRIRSSHHDTYESARNEQARLIRREDPAWTALVRDRRISNGIQSGHAPVDSL